MRIGIYVDSLIGIGGATRVQIELANNLNADIITAGFNPEVTKWFPIKGKIIDIGNLTHKFNGAISYFFESPLRFLFCKSFNYDLHIFMGTSSIFASKKENNNVWFCFSPNRFMYDMKEWKLSNSDIFRRYIFKLHVLMFQRKDQEVIKNNFRTIIAQTKTVKQRIKKYYRKKSSIIYSPLNTSIYNFKEFGDFYLAVSRLTAEKRMDLIAKAFTKMAHKKLILVGDGPDRHKLEQIIKGHNNIKFLKTVDEKKLIDLYANCFAVIYMPIDEDYGLVPLEGMASGKICIAANEGGCLETVINGKTGFLIEAEENKLIETVKTLNIKKVQSMKNYSIKWSKNFDIKIIIKQWEKVISTIN